MFRRSIISAAALSVALGLAACGGGGSNTNSVATPPTAPVASLPRVTVGDTIALTVSDRLMSFNRDRPGVQIGAVNVVGLLNDETLLGIDIRPANGALYALGSKGGIYRVDPATGEASLASTLRPAAGDDNPFTTLSGTIFGLAFNPVADRLRVVSNTGQNLRINVDTGGAITDGVLNPASAEMSGSAYTNAFPGATSTRLFTLNTSTNTFEVQDPSNNVMTASGATLGVVADPVKGFDIDARTNTGYAVLAGGASADRLYRIDLASVGPDRAASHVGAIAGGEGIRGFTLVQPGAMQVTGLTADNRLVGFDARTPNTLTSNVAISGLNAGERILGIDVQPADLQLWGVSSTGRLYTLNPDTGAATFRVALSADPTDSTAPFTTLDASSTLSVDFNPAGDRLRVISTSGQNLRIFADTGATTTDGAINRASGAASVLAAAYSNNFRFALATTLFTLDGNADVLAVQNPPNDGALTNIGALGVDISGLVAFDIAGGDNGLPLVALRSGNSGPSLLQTISLATGAITPYLNTSGNSALSQIGGANGPALLDIAIRP